MNGLNQSPERQFVVVGLGGSAGAIASFREFFRNVPPDSGMAYVVILHLSPEHESRLDEVLQTASGIPVHQVRERVRIEPDQVYVIPPNRSLSVQDGTLVLSDVRSFEERRAPIDIFFRTLADSHGSRAVCVILSGSGSDGSMGLRRIKENEGLVLVQDPSEASFSEMPRSSIATGLADFVVPVAEMPERIVAYRDQLQTVRIPESDDERTEDDEQALMQIFTLLRVRTGHDFSNYKRSTVVRRIERRMAVNRVTTIPGYAELLRTHPEEPQALLRELLISVTNFFRDREVWEEVERSIIPRLLENKGADDHVRIWVPGCATGEEAYSIAMVVAEREPAVNVQIFATDLDENAIAHARNGLFNEAEVADVSPERLRRFFARQRDGYRVRSEIREMVLFAHHNLIKDPPFLHLDFVSCRNVLIYLNRAAQQRALEVLHFALEPGGYLLLGNAEVADGGANLFSMVNKETRIYRSRAVPRVATATPLVPAGPAEARPQTQSPLRPAEALTSERFVPIDLHHRLLEQYAPPSLIVDEQYDIIHLSERAGRYLQFAAGEASTNLLQVVRPELRADLRSALVQAAQKRSTVVSPELVVHTGDRTETIRIAIRPALREGDIASGFFLVVFEDARDAADLPPVGPPPADPAARQLEDELIRVKAQMRMTVEQYEVQVEESRATNEELQAMNEELRSTAEELETSQEELQSVNEELQTVNQELKIKIDEISHASDDMRNLMSSTEIGTIFVDRSLRVKLFTPRVRDIFNLIAADIGRPLLDITSRLPLENLGADLERVLDRLQTIEQEIETRAGTWYLMRLLPYRTAEDRIDGVVLTFIDITERRRAELALRDSGERLRRAIEIETVGVVFFKLSDGEITYANDAFLRMSGYERADFEKGRVRRDDLTAPESLTDSRDAALQFDQHGRSAPYEKEYVRRDGTRWWALFAATRIDSDQGVEFLIDITDRKKADEALRVSQLEREREQLLRRAVESQEADRQRIARELHDEMGQHITALKLGLEALPPGPPVQRLIGVIANLDQSIDRLTFALRPPAVDELGLHGAIASLAEQLTTTTGLRVDVHLDGIEELRMTALVDRVVYRVVQEALTNISKHAGARTVSVIVERHDQELRMIVEDDGKGFTERAVEGVRNGRFGLIGMRERLALVGGTLTIESEPGRGTTLYVRVPIPSAGRP